MKKINYIVEGMRCASCQASVNNNVKKVDGVKSCNTNLLSGLLEVEAEDYLKEDDVLVAISATGFKGYIKKDNKLSFDIDKYFNLYELIISLICMVIVMYISMTNMLVSSESLHNYIFDVFNHMINPVGYSVTLLVFSIPVFIIGFRFYIPGLKTLFKLHPNMDSLISIGSITAFIYSFVYTIIILIDPINNAHYGMNLLYEASVTVISLIYLGKYIEQVSKNKAKKSINDLVNLIPINANIVDENNNIKEVCVNALKVDDVILCKAGEKVPVDGVVISGASNIDTSLITGESEPRKVKQGDTIFAGSTLLDNYLYIKASKINADTTLNSILALVSKASVSKSKISNLVDKISFYFVPIVLLISLLTFIVWISVDYNNPINAVRNFINTLVIACPCSIGLAIPLANVISSVKALKNGIIYKNSEVHNIIKDINYVVFDKTGTLTTGNFDIKIHVIDNNYSKLDIYSILGSLEENNSHPIGVSIMKYINDNKISFINNIEKEDIQSVGIKGIINNDIYLFGNYKITLNIDDIDTLNLDKSYLYLLKNNKIIASIYLEDEISKGSLELIKYLKSKNINILMLTGDNEKKAKLIADKLGIDNFLSDLLPSDKYDVIEDLKSDKNNKIMYLGDGINDAPSLNLADVSITPYKSSDIANESSDIYLLNEDLSLIIDIFKLSKYTHNIIFINIIWAFIYNIVAMIFAIGIFIPFGIGLEAWMSALSMSLSSICVILTSLTINFAIKKRK